MKHLVTLAALLALGLTSDLDKRDSVHLTLFYESYCPYSIKFVVNQLYDTWSEYKQHIRLDMVPYGHANETYTHGHYKFQCQHGPKECVGNILHACAIYETCGPKGTSQCPAAKLTKVMSYIDCVMQQSNQRKASNKCATKAGLVPKAINRCARSKLGERLEVRNGKQTRAFKNPPMHFVPFIIINNKHTDKEQGEAESNLKQLICKKYIKC